MSTRPPELIYATPPRYNLPAIAGVIGLLVGVDLLFIILFPEIMWFMVVTLVLEIALFYVIIPRSYRIYADRFRIELGRPFKMDVPFTTIREARAGRAADAFVYWGMRMATSGENVVEIIRRGGGLDVVISPADREIFLEQLRLAMGAARRNGAGFTSSMPQ